MKPRSAGVKLVYNGTDITADIAADIESISYEGNAADDSDSVNVTINAMADKWLNDWMPEKGTSLDPTILVYNWPEEGQGGEMNNGVMTVDDISYSDAPCTMTMSATSKPNDTSFSEEDREYIWKNTSIQKIAQTIAERYSLEMLLRKYYNLKDAIIIDITGDQFTNQKCFLYYNIPVYVGFLDDFHKLFRVDQCSIHEPARLWDARCKSLYRAITKYIK